MPVPSCQYKGKKWADRTGIWSRGKGDGAGHRGVPGHSSFSESEIFGLVAQARRAAVSIPSNIAEGQGRLSHKEFRYFLGQARGSLMELETQIQIARNLEYLQETEADVLMAYCAELGRVLNGLITSVSKQSGS